MDWDAPAIVLDARPYGEGDAIATVMTAEHGAHRGLARGGAARGRTAIWQPGNLVQVRWVARLAEQLGSFSAELVHPAAALAMDDALALAMLSARLCAWRKARCRSANRIRACSTGLLHLIAHLPQGEAMLSDLIRWETVLLADLGYGLDLTSCAVTGETAGLAFVSPKTGRAVTAAGAGVWTSRLLRLPSFLVGGNDGHAGGLARRAAADRPFPGARRVRPPPPPAAGRAPDAIRPRRGAGRRIGAAGCRMT